MKAKLKQKKAKDKRPDLNAISAGAGTKDMCYVISIGDDGAILTAIGKGKLHKRIFLTSPGAPELADELLKNPKAPITILVDVIDQTYVKQTLPPVSSLNIKKLINRKIEKDFDEDDLTAYTMLEDISQKKTKDWTVLFLSVRYVTPLSDWIEAISEFDNYIQGVHLLPVESGDMLHKMRKQYAKPDDKDAPKWHMIISHNRLSGFRQSVYYNEKIIFTRVAQPLDSNDAAVIAGSIEQEALNIIEYIRRLGFQERDGLEVYIIASLKVCNSLANVNFFNAEVYAHTPYEIAQTLGIEHAAEENDRYGDVVSAVHLVEKKKRQINFETKAMKKIKKWLLVKRIAIGLLIIGALVLAYFAYTFMDSISESKDDINTSNKKRIAVEKSLSLQKETLTVFAENIESLAEFRKLTEGLGLNQNALFDFIKAYASVRGFDVSVSQMTSSIVEDNRKGDSITANFSIDFLNRGNKSVDKLFDDSEQFASEIKDALGNFEIVFNGLPNQSSTTLDLANTNPVQSSTMTVQMQVSGSINPKEEKK